MRRYDEEIEVRTGPIDAQEGPARGDSDETSADHDLLGEEGIWLVVARAGATASSGVYELAHSWGSGRWRLRGVVD